MQSKSCGDLRNESCSKQGALPPLRNDRKQKPKPLLPVMRSTKAYVTQRQLSPDLRDFFAIACRRNNPHDTSMHLEARIGFRRPKKYLRLRPLGSSEGRPVDVAPWMRSAFAGGKGTIGVSSTPDLRHVQEDDGLPDEAHDLMVDLEEHERVAADAIGKVFREAYFFEAANC